MTQGHAVNKPPHRALTPRSSFGTAAAPRGAAVCTGSSAASPAWQRTGRGPQHQGGRVCQYLQVCELPGRLSLEAQGLRQEGVQVLQAQRVHLWGGRVGLSLAATGRSHWRRVHRCISSSRGDGGGGERALAPPGPRADLGRQCAHFPAGQTVLECQKELES